MEKLLQLLSVMALGMLISVLALVPLEMYVVRDIVYLFHIVQPGQISNLTEIIYGSLLIITIATLKIPKEKEKSQTPTKMLAKAVEKAFICACVLMLIWTTAYLVHHIWL